MGDKPTTSSPSTADAKAEAQLGELLKQLQAQQQAELSAREDSPGYAPVETSGFTFEGMMVGLIVSAVGLGYLRYGKAMANPLLIVTGVVLLVIPWFIMDALWLGLVGLGIAALSFGASRILFPSSL